MLEILNYFNGNPVLALIILTLLPFLELRASIPYGIFNTDLHWTSVFFICVVTNIILGPVIYFLLDNFIHLFTKIKTIEKIYHKTVEKTQKKIHKAVEKWGELGVAIFIGIPLPGSGSYSGALGSYVIGLGLKKFTIANIFGVAIAGVLVLLACFTGSGLFDIFIKTGL